MPRTRRHPRFQVGLKFLVPAAASAASATIYEVPRVPTIFPGSNTFFLARIPDTRYTRIPGYISHAPFRPSMYPVRCSSEGLLTQQPPNEAIFRYVASNHKFFHADSSRNTLRNHGLRCRCDASLRPTLFSAFSLRPSLRSTIDFHSRSTSFNTNEQRSVHVHRSHLFKTPRRFHLIHCTVQLLSELYFVDAKKDTRSFIF